MQSVPGEIKWYQVTHSISHHYVTTGSTAIALHTHAYMCRRRAFSPAGSKLAAFSSIYNTNTHKLPPPQIGIGIWRDLLKIKRSKSIGEFSRCLPFLLFFPPHLITVHFEY